ncbi:MAG: acyl-[acyl-carrier-protein]-phospholipid O-acyltransferase [Gammaproteobacteria bacterium]|jgi:acyl-[acyl-carrier-protein]-phospholipid O-acyltransferase/long-chain-fatty-acid--[acyl-carrier-protein] ligase
MIRFIKLILRYILRTLYQVETSGMENYLKAGKRVLIVANHTSLLDGILLYAWLPETPTFAINTDIASKRSFRFFLRFVDLFVMDPNSALPIKSMIKFIREDKKAVIFPEGRITVTGTLMKIYEGPALIADKANAMILPIAIDGAQLSPFSYMRDRGHVKRFPKITLTILPPEKIELDPTLSSHDRRKLASIKLQKLMLKLQYATYNNKKTLFAAMTEASDKYGQNLVILEDTSNTKLTYKQLFTRSFVLARIMDKQTIAGENVGLMLPNVNAMAASFLALQYLGRVPAMLNFSAGSQNIIKACETAKLKTIYTSRLFIQKAGFDTLIEDLKSHVDIIYLEDLRQLIRLTDKILGVWQALNPLKSYLKRGQFNPQGPAVILFTSGSEGIPKGAVLSHENILSNFAQVCIHIDFKPSDVVFTCLPLFHSFGLNAGFIMPILGGSKVYLYPTPLHYRLIPQLIYDKNATIFFGTNTFYKGYAKYAHPYDFNSLRFVVAGAEKLREDTRQLYMEKFGIRIFEGYGVTETSPVISVNAPLIFKYGTVGLPMPNIEYYLEPVDGIEDGGRLFVKGPNIMLGYLLHDSDGKIIPPISSRGEGWHDTGDIADIDEEGYFTILGRAKRFAKLGGEMISLTAVEELAIQTWPDANHAAVSIVDDKKGEKIILVTDQHDANRKAFQDTTRRLKYSEIYIPKKIVFADQLPILGTGKTDYFLLTQMANDEEKEGSGWIAKIENLVKNSTTESKPEENSKNH